MSDQVEILEQPADNAVGANSPTPSPRAAQPRLPIPVIC